MVRNCAFVFIKPHAVTDKAKDLVKETLAAKEIEIKKEGSIEAEDIDKKMLIDKHYYAIAAKATLKTQRAACAERQVQGTLRRGMGRDAEGREGFQSEGCM